MSENELITSLSIWGDKVLQYLRENQTFLILGAVIIAGIIVLAIVVKNHLSDRSKTVPKVTKKIVPPFEFESPIPKPNITSCQTAFGPTEAEVMRGEEAERRRPSLPPQHTPEPNKWKLVSLISNAKPAKAQ